MTTSRSAPVAALSLALSCGASQHANPAPAGGSSLPPGASDTVVSAPAASVAPLPPPRSIDPSPTITVMHTQGPIVIDGRFDEPTWQTATATPPFVDPYTGAYASADHAQATVRVAWDEAGVYFAWTVQDGYIVDTSVHRDEPLWNADAVQMVLDPGGDRRDYFEFLVSPHNHIFDAIHVRPPAAGSHGDPSFDADIRSASRPTAGSGDTAGTEAGYTVELSIPWRDMVQRAGGHMPPGPTDLWRANFFLADMARDNAHRFLAWSRVAPNNDHDIAHYGTLTFAAAR